MISVKVFKRMERGLVAEKSFKKGDMLLTVEVIVLSQQDTKKIEKTLLNKYVYCLGNGKTCLALGLGSLFNHSDSENVDFLIRKVKNRFLISYKALRAIKKGEQLFLNYGWRPHA